VQVELEGRSVGHRYILSRGLTPVSFDWSGPGIVAVTGPNGSGKSTLLRILAGLLRPSLGTSRLRIGGREYPRAERRRVTGWASPDLQFYAELTVRENLSFAAEAGGLSSVATRVQAAAQAVGLGARLDDRVAALSSGMKQRLRLAFARLGDPPILLLDEPGSHLDDAGRAELREQIERVRATALVVLATNDSRESDLAERRLALAGRGLGDPA
jgi:heme exporter protein A